VGKKRRGRGGVLVQQNCLQEDEQGVVEKQQNCAT